MLHASDKRRNRFVSPRGARFGGIVVAGVRGWGRAYPGGKQCLMFLCVGGRIFTVREFRAFTGVNQQNGIKIRSRYSSSAGDKGPGRAGAGPGCPERRDGATARGGGIGLPLMHAGIDPAGDGAADVSGRSEEERVHQAGNVRALRCPRPCSGRVRQYILTHAAD